MDCVFALEQMMDYEFVDRLKKRLDEIFEAKFNSIFTTKDSHDLREIIGFMRATDLFHEIIKQEINPQKKRAEE